MEDQIRRIKEKLRFIQIIGWDKFDDNFAVARNKFHMNPPISESKLQKFETSYKVRLPEDYRIFLLEIGNGGAGPFYGLLPLEQWFHAFNIVGPLPILTDPFGQFSLRASNFDPIEHFLIECSVQADNLKGYGLNPTKENLENALRGTISITDQGCNFYTLLPITGKARGKIYYIDMMSEPFFMPDPNFISWYERWLDEILIGKKIGWFGGSGFMGNDEPYTWKPRELSNIVRNNNFYSKDELKYLPNGGYDYVF